MTTNQNEARVEKLTTEQKVGMYHSNRTKKAVYEINKKKNKMVSDFLESGYLDTSTRQLIFKRMITEINSVSKQGSELETAAFCLSAYEDLIAGIQELFDNSRKMVTYFKYYTGKSELSRVTQTDVLNVIVAISKRDRSNFERLNLNEEVTEYIHEEVAE